MEIEHPNKTFFDNGNVHTSDMQYNIIFQLYLLSTGIVMNVTGGLKF